jgi:hypothetical protein
MEKLRRFYYYCIVRIDPNDVDKDDFFEMSELGSILMEVISDFCLTNLLQMKDIRNCRDDDNFLTHNIEVFKEVC